VPVGPLVGRAPVPFRMLERSAYCSGQPFRTPPFGSPRCLQKFEQINQPPLPGGTSPQRPGPASISGKKRKGPQHGLGRLGPGPVWQTGSRVLHPRLCPNHHRRPSSIRLDFPSWSHPSPSPARIEKGLFGPRRTAPAAASGNRAPWRFRLPRAASPPGGWGRARPITRLAQDLIGLRRFVSTPRARQNAAPQLNSCDKKRTKKYKKDV